VTTGLALSEPIMKRTWYPPKSLIGPHWEVQLMHVVTQQWVTYTEHTTEQQARSLAERYSMTVGKDCRVVEVTP
jgi:tryptophan-rich sensory protein